MEAGELVPDSLTNELIKDKLSKIEDQSWILDGYPRNMSQVKFYSLKKTYTICCLLL